MSVLTTAQNYFEEGDYAKAFPLLHSRSETEPRCEHTQHMLGVIYYDQGQFKKSISCFSKALKINPHFTDSSIGLSVVLNDLGKYAEGKQVFLQAQKRLQERKKNPEKDPLIRPLASQAAYKHMELCHLYQEMQNFLKALEQLQAYESLIGENESTVFEKFKILKQNGSFAEATQVLERWLHKHPSPQANLWYQLAQTHYLNRTPLKALAVCEKILKQHPLHKDTQNFYDKLKQTQFDLTTGAKRP